MDKKNLKAIEWQLAEDSSTIHSFGYDEKSSTLFVIFKDKQGNETRTYQYEGVEKDKWLNMVAIQASPYSTGSWFNENIKKNPAYKTTEIK